MSDKRFRDDDGKLDLGKIKRYEDSSYKVLLLLKYIEEQQDTIQSLKEENDNCRNDYRKQWTVGELIKELEKCDKDKPVEVSVLYDNCEHIQKLNHVYDFKDAYLGDGWVTLRGGKR